MTAIATSLDRGSSFDLQRRTAQGAACEVLAQIYEADVNLAVWQRELTEDLQDSARHFANLQPAKQVAGAIAVSNIESDLLSRIGNDHSSEALRQDVAYLADMFGCLFDLKVIGLRLTTLDRAMCPRFHVDQVPCRLVTTYCGSGSEWLPHERVNRDKLGPLSEGKADEESGLFQSNDDIERIKPGHVALLKGECWVGNEGAGLVHRSPQLEAGARRLLLTLDFARN